MLTYKQWENMPSLTQAKKMQQMQYTLTDDVKLTLVMEFNGDVYSRYEVEIPKGTEIERFGLDKYINKIFDENRRVQMIRTIIALAS